MRHLEAREQKRECLRRNIKLIDESSGRHEESAGKVLRDLKKCRKK